MVWLGQELFLLGLPIKLSPLRVVDGGGGLVGLIGQANNACKMEPHLVHLLS